MFTLLHVFYRSGNHIISYPIKDIECKGELLITSSGQQMLIGIGFTH